MQHRKTKHDPRRTRGAAVPAALCGAACRWSSGRWQHHQNRAANPRHRSGSGDRCARRRPMTAMLSELYGALKDAGASEDKARKAAEEVAAFNNRLTKLDTLARVTVGLLAALAAPNIV